ncbi:MAG: DNA gyrase subunit A [Rhodospirillales bacterium]|nr:DNA gyrase subunit A [Rhodospirillales bacterium]MCB9996078.1 DNA gyrase subunit A [Rhodospirillales bacterium]
MSDSAVSGGDELPGISLEEEMKTSYLDYAMSVIVSRALPDIRDGLKPVHRRILYAMRQGGYTSDKPYRKSARIVGDVMGQYHPHGDFAIYDAMVRMAQDFSMRLPLVDGQGNFGSMDGDPPAAMRYTEARLTKAAETILDDIDKDTVDFHPNYDESLKEPDVLPSRVPNLLVNGAGGIAVGMATNIPPHNLGEVIDACHAYIENPEITTDELIQYIPGPDFPTGGQILGRNGIMSAYHTGSGSMPMRAKAEFEPVGEKREAIVVTEVPYQVNKGRLLERLGEVAREKIVEDISEIRDESDRDGVRIVVELKRGANADVVLNQLYKHTALQTTFPANMVALNRGRPEMLKLHDFIHAFIRFREEVITRRTIFELGKARDRAHVLAGLAVAVANIDDVIKLIREAKDPVTAREQLLAKPWPASDIEPLIALIDDPEYPVVDGKYQLSETQARAILDLRLHRLTGLERDKIGDELKEITDRIAEFLAILGSREKLMDVMRGELDEIKAKYATPRRTELLDIEFEEDIEELIQREDMVVTVTNGGYVKRVPLDTYRAQRRGGKGRSGTALKDEDFVSDLFVGSTHTPILFFTSRGIVHKMKVWQLPLASPQSRGKALVNLLPLEQDEYVSVYLRLPEDEELWDQLDIVFATSHGTIRRNKLTDFKNIRSNGLIAMKLGDDESLVSVKICRFDEDIMLATRLGKAIRFAVGDVRLFAGRTSTGVRGVKLGKGDEVISMSILKHVESEPDERTAYLKIASQLRGADEEGMEFEAGGVELSEERFKELQDKEQFLLSVSEKGFGKRTSSYEYRVTGRGGQGVVNMGLTKKNGGAVVATFPVTDDHQVMLVTDKGKLIRTPVRDVRFTGRSAQGVTLFKVAEDETVMSVAWLIEEDEEEDVTAAEQTVAPADAEAAEVAEAEAPDADEPEASDSEE